MKIIFAQGNPGSEFKQTRHNVGFVILDSLAEEHSAAFMTKTKFDAELAEATIDTQKVLLVKPQTFYNETGKSLRSIVDFYKIESEDVLVIHDELMLPFGKIRVRHSGRDAGNNGIKSLNSHIGDSFARIRIGVQNDMRSTMGDTDFVLGKFSQTEQELLASHIIPKVMDFVYQFTTNNLSDESVSLIPESTS